MQGYYKIQQTKMYLEIPPHSNTFKPKNILYYLLMSYRIITLQDDNLSIEYIQENGFINATKLCRDYKKDFYIWKKEYYDNLYVALQTFCNINNITTYQSLEYMNELFIDPSIGLHLAYWIDYQLGINLCAFLFKMINHSFSCSHSYSQSLSHPDS